MNKALSAASVALILFSCKPEIDVPAPGKGSIDATKYVAIGNSFSAGYADNALYQQAQLVSYPNLLAQQLKLVGGGEFKQPLVDAVSVGIGAMQNARYILAPVTDCGGVTSLAPKTAANMGDFTIFMNRVQSPGTYNNLSVPGVKSITAIYPGYGDPAKGIGNYNPFFTRFASNPETASILSDAAAQGASFFTLAIGHDDIYTYALAGGAQDGITPLNGAPGLGFDGSADLIVTTMKMNGAKGVIINIPALSSMPFFTTVPFNGLMLDQANADALTAAYSPLGMTFQPGPNAFVIQDDNAPGGMRKINQGEMILLTVPQDSLKCAGWGSMKPIPNQFVLTADEISEINGAVSDYNTKLAALATSEGLAYVDMNAFMNRANSGIMYNGVGMNAKFVSGGIFSLDGINMTPRGNALFTNEIIKAINAKYGATLPQIDATRYKGVVFP